MAEERISVVLSTDLKNSVIVKGETWDEIEQLMPKARELYASLTAEFGVKTYGSKAPAGTPRGTTSGAPSTGPGVACADCGEPIKGKKDQKTGQFQNATEVAGWGQKKYGRALCLANVNGCYSKAGAGSSSASSAPARRAPRQQPADELEF